MWKAERIIRLRVETVPEAGRSRRRDGRENMSVWTTEFEVPVTVLWAPCKQPKAPCMWEGLSYYHWCYHSY